jgi:hypothetical protein
MPLELREKAKAFKAASNEGVLWLLTHGWWLIGGAVLIYLVSGFCIGFPVAYNVMIGVTSPADVRSPIAWLLSAVGWLVIPAIIGGAAGARIASQAEQLRSKDSEMFEPRPTHAPPTHPPPPSSPT